MIVAPTSKHIELFSRLIAVRESSTVQGDASVTMASRRGVGHGRSSGDGVLLGVGNRGSGDMMSLGVGQGRWVLGIGDRCSLVGGVGNWRGLVGGVGDRGLGSVVGGDGSGEFLRVCNGSGQMLLSGVGGDWRRMVGGVGERCSMGDGGQRGGTVGQSDSGQGSSRSELCGMLGYTVSEDDSIESVQSIGGVLDSASLTVRLDQGVLTLDVVALSGLMLFLDITGVRVIHGVREVVLCRRVLLHLMQSVRWCGVGHLTGVQEGLLDRQKTGVGHNQKGAKSDELCMDRNTNTVKVKRTRFTPD